MFLWCEDRGQRVDERVCLHKLEAGQCDGTLGDCSPHKDPIKISEEERARRAERMRAIAKHRTSRKPRLIEDNDGEEEVKENEQGTILD